MKNAAYIEDYFSRQQATTEKEAFEARIITDASFAEEVAFYVQATAVLKEEAKQEKKDHFRELYRQQQEHTKVIQMPVKKIWKYMAAASVAVVMIAAAWLFTGSDSPQQMADKYIKANIQTLSVNMGGTEDSLQQALALYNTNNFPGALRYFETMLKNDSTNATVLKYAGFTALRLAKYDKAESYFEKLAADSTLTANAGKFYQALTLMKRNNAGDSKLIKELLNQVVVGNLDGKLQAEEWLKKMQ